MRAEALRTLIDLAEDDSRIVFLTGDLGYGVVEEFFRRFPQRAFNVGVAEQNMLAMATGLAEAGLRPYVYSIATFASLRPFEFIRNGPVLHQLPVRIIGVGGGMEYTTNGITHLGLEDVGVLRTLPGLSIICPTDTPQTRSVLEATVDDPSPIYFRLSKQELALIEGREPGWNLEGVDVLSNGDGSVALFALGAAAAGLPLIERLLQEHGVRPTTVAVSRIAPSPCDTLRSLAERHQLVVSVESHYLAGGLGSLLCEVIAEAGLRVRVMRCAVELSPNGIFGSVAHLAKWAKIDPVSVANRILLALEKRPTDTR